MKQHPLVTIGVVTYNSGSFITETLDSIYNQSYENIELIISDDCSADNTPELCKSWLREHSNRFKRTKLLTSDINTGVSANSNRALNEATGDWYKCFDGDDIMTKNAIQDYVSFVDSNSEIEMTMADVKALRENGKGPLLPVPIKKLFYGEKSTSKKQASIISKRIIGNSQSFFIKTSVLRNEGGFDERFPLLEDYPLFIKLINKGHKMFFMDKVTAEYRTVSGSISHNKKDSSILPKSTIKCVEEYHYDYQREYLSLLWQRLLDLSIFLKKKVILSGNSYSSFRSRFYYRLMKMFDPFFFYKKYTNFLNNLF